jgi:hypothetical protein
MRHAVVDHLATIKGNQNINAKTKVSAILAKVKKAANTITEFVLCDTMAPLAIAA